MKGMRGLILALVAGIVATACNWIYLQNKARDVEKIGFLGIRSEVAVLRGERLAESQFEEVQIPKQWVGNLEKYAYRYSDRQSVVGMTVSRTQNGPTLLLQQDLRTPPPELKLTPSGSLDTGEGLMWVPVDVKSFVPALVTPGEDMVSFIFSTNRGVPTLAAPEGRTGSSTPGKTEAGKPGADKAEPAAAPAEVASRQASGGGPEIVGPFKVLALGNRLGNMDVMRAAKIPQTQENVIGILAKLEGGKLEPKAARLWTLLEATNFRQVTVYKHAPQSKDAN